MIEYPSSLVEIIDLPISPDAPCHHAARSLSGTRVPVRLGSSRLSALVWDVVCYPGNVEIWVYLPMIDVALPGDAPSCVA
jgi:hypothetical protein